MKSLKNESGLAHLGLILLAVIVIGAGTVTYWRVSKTDEPQSSLNDVTASEQIEALPQNLEDLKTIDEISQIAGATNGETIIKFVLESEDGSYVYKVVLSNGKKLVIDATSGNVLSEETTDVSEDDKIPGGIQITVSPADAYRIAAEKSTSPIKSIEMEVEDKKVVYKIEYKDGSKIELDASGGAVVKSEIKNESEDDGDDDQNEDENEDEDRDNEDSDDSQDEENHAEEDN